MRVLDLENMCFTTKKKNTIQLITGKKTNCNSGGMSYAQFAEELDKFYDQVLAIVNTDYVRFSIEFEDNSVVYSEQLAFAQYAINSLVAKLTYAEKRDRESRLNIPKVLDKLPNISRINLLRAINCRTRVKGFCGYVSINGEKFDLLGSY